MVAIKFTNPPVVEVILGIELENIGFSLIHFGLYWQTIQDRFPLQIDQPVIPLKKEEEDFQSSFTRALFMSSDNRQIIHLQNNFFGFSLKHNNEYKYPHFEEIFKHFLEEWIHFQKWYEGQKIGGSLKFGRYELTYLNLLDKDVGWNSADDNHHIFTFLNRSSGEFLNNLFSQDSQLNFYLSDKREILNVAIDHRVSEEEDSDFLFFRLTIMGWDTSKDLTAWFQLAHTYIVKSFLDLTTEEARKIWGQLDE